MFFSLFAGILAKLHQGAYGRLRVEEGDVEPFGALPGGLVDEAATFLLSFSQGVGYSILDGESDVLDSTASAVVGDELGDGALRGGTLEELDFSLSDLEKGGLYFLVFNFFDGKTLKAENVLVEGDCFLQGGDSNADVFNMADIHK